MSTSKVHVATRKGLFTWERRSLKGGWKIASVDFLAEPVTQMLQDPRDGTLYAALNLGHFGVKLHRSQDGGKTWEEIAVPAFPKVEGEEGPSVTQVWALEAGGPDQPGTVWAGTIPAALFRSDDRGTSWQRVDSLWNLPQRSKWFGGGYDQPGIHSICVHPSDSKALAVGISCGGVWLTKDGCQTWEARTKGMIAEYMPPDQQEDPDIQDPHRLVQCPAAPDHYWVQHHNGIFGTTNDGATWTFYREVAPSCFGFAVAVHPADPKTAWFVPAVKDQTRVPSEGRMVVTRTCDGGRNFEVLAKGLPEKDAYDIVYRHALDVDSEGTTLAMGSTTGNLWVSEDAGESWECLSNHLPPIYAVRFPR